MSRKERKSWGVAKNQRKYWNWENKLKSPVKKVILVEIEVVIVKSLKLLLFLMIFIHLICLSSWYGMKYDVWLWENNLWEKCFWGKWFLGALGYWFWVNEKATSLYTSPKTATASWALNEITIYSLGDCFVGGHRMET